MTYSRYLCNILIIILLDVKNRSVIRYFLFFIQFNLIFYFIYENAIISNKLIKN